MYLKITVRALLVVLLGACATIDPHSAPPDWPVLTVRVVIINSESIFKKLCGESRPGHRIEGCAIINFNQKTCTIYLAKGRGEAPWVIEEEKDHCDGKDHPGEDSIRRAWGERKERQSNPFYQQ